jgi:hypothetical protein
MAGFIFNEGAHKLLDGSIDWAADTIKVRPILTSASPDIDADVVTGIGITGGDITLGSKTGPTKVDGTNRVSYDAADPTFIAQPLGAEIDSILVFKFVTNDADSIPIAVVDITPVTPNGGNIAITFDAVGIFYTQQ